MKKYTDMTDKEIEDFVNIHDMYDLVTSSTGGAQGEGEDVMKMLDIEESAKLMYKY